METEPRIRGVRLENPTLDMGTMVSLRDDMRVFNAQNAIDP